jgi:hypothetical protein
MNIKLALASLAMLAFAGAALAEDISLNAGYLPISPAAPYGHVFTHEAGSFTDTIDFVVQLSSLGASMNPVDVALGGANVFHISNLTFSLWDSTSMDANSVLYGTFLGNNTSYQPGLTKPGPYHLIVTGIADGSSGGSYGVALASAVPEPLSLTLMLAGLGVLGRRAAQEHRLKKRA